MQEGKSAAARSLSLSLSLSLSPSLSLSLSLSLSSRSLSVFFFGPSLLLFAPLFTHTRRREIEPPTLPLMTPFFLGHDPLCAPAEEFHRRRRRRQQRPRRRRAPECRRRRRQLFGPRRGPGEARRRHGNGRRLVPRSRGRRVLRQPPRGEEEFFP
jgi:hypothetical protein